MLRPNVFIILWASFIKFFRASGEGITAIVVQHICVRSYYHRYIVVEKLLMDTL